MRWMSSLRGYSKPLKVAPETPYVVVGNLPYNVGTAIVRRFLESTRPPKRLVVMLQREVAASMTAPTGDMGLLGVSVQVYAQAKRLFNVPPRAFYPPPRVVSSVVRLDLREQPLVTIEERERFFRVVRAGFSAPRKQLRNTLAQGLDVPAADAAAMIEAAGLEPTLRPQQLSLDDWLRLIEKGQFVTLELIAPAKLNYVLEVTGRRPDGYHELVSLMQTISVVDRVLLDEASDIDIEVLGEQLMGVPLEGPSNLAYAAAHALAQAANRNDLGVHIELDKQIPAGMGLGGGSSDAAAVLRGLNRLWGLDMSVEELMAVGAGVGSDVPFFIAGGAALITGRGEHVEALPDGESRRLTLFVSEIEIDDKTRRMYSMLSPADFTDGHKARVAAESVRRGLHLAESELYNAFDRHIGQVAAPLEGALMLCRDAELAVLAAGSGPASSARRRSMSCRVCCCASSSATGACTPSTAPAFRAQKRRRFARCRWQRRSPASSPATSWR